MSATGVAGITPATLAANKHHMQAKNEPEADELLLPEQTAADTPSIFLPHAEGDEVVPQPLCVVNRMDVSGTQVMAEGSSNVVILKEEEEAATPVRLFKTADLKASLQPPASQVLNVMKSLAASATAEVNSASPMPSLNSQVNMGSVLTAIASHLQNQNRKRAASEALEELSQERTQPIILRLPQNHETQSPARQTVSVGELNSNTEEETIIQTFSPSDLPSRNQTYQVHEDSTDGTTTLVVDASQLTEGTLLETEFGTFSVQHFNGNPVSPDSSSTKHTAAGPCPICGDRISGYHYGIYSCESCKGFFKRTVQNNKTFVCHREGECEINITNRKKCPACRFQRCIMFGMKLAAIRGDRTRGGRSSYSGCSPVNRKSVRHNNPWHVSQGQEQVIQVQYEDVLGQEALGSPGVTTFQIPKTSADGPGVVTSQEPVIQNVSVDEQVPVQMPQTPQVMEDLLTLESLVAEEESEQDCCQGRLQEGDENLFASLLHIADHCLYRIVRWARNLPEFSNVSTDDQILLLQNCWAELLCLSVCWNSARGDGTQLQLSHGRSLNLEMAKAMGLAEVIQRLIDFTQHLKRLEVDSHEYAALKVLILMSPDVDDLKDPPIIRDYQERILEALLVHSLTHYPSLPNKHAEQLVRLAELTRTCALGKEQLKARQTAGEVPQFSLLSELLKGVVGGGAVAPTE